jgi:serine/threonine-protein kinase
VTQPAHSEAYDLTLQGRYFFVRGGRENYTKALSYFQQAIARDAGYAPAWASVAEVYSAQADTGYASVDAAYHEARQAAEQAVKLDPNLPDAYSALANVKRNYDWDWSGADAEMQRARALAPNSATVLRRSAFVVATLGRIDEALRLDRQAAAADPLTPLNWHTLGLHAFYVGRLDEAERAVRKAIELKPEMRAEHALLALLHVSQGQPRDALTDLRLEPDPLWQGQGLAILYHALGRRSDADAALADYITRFQHNAAFLIAEVYAFRGDADHAFEWLDRACAHRDGQLTNLKGDPLLKSLEKDPRYVAFLKKMRLPL